MIPGWQAKIDAAQDEKTADVGGADYPRIAHVGDGECGDCAARAGQLHISSCTRERCPRCITGQRYGCSCFITDPQLSRVH
jgi:hypothetical protein